MPPHLPTTLGRPAERGGEGKSSVLLNTLMRAHTESQGHQVQLAHTSQASDSNSDRNSVCRGGGLKVAMEHKLNLMKVRHQSLEKQNALSSVEENEFQISTLLRMRGSQTEPQQQEQLSAMLEWKNGEIKHLFR